MKTFRIFLKDGRTITVKGDTVNATSGGLVQIYDSEHQKAEMFLNPNEIVAVIDTEYLVQESGPAQP